MAIMNKRNVADAPRLLILLAVLALSAAFVACGGDQEETAEPQATATTAPTATPEPTEPATEGPAGPTGSIAVAVAEVPPLLQNPTTDIRATGGIGKDFSVWETIVRAPHVSPPDPPPMDHTEYSPDDLGLAESWEVADDLSSITFDIRADIPWHSNGGDWGLLDADDVAWSYNQAFKPESVNNGAEEIGPGMKAGFEVTGPLQVRQNIEPGAFDPTWTWLQGNASFNGIVIVNEDAFMELGEEEFAQTPIGTGKYRALSWRADEEVQLEAVEDHWTGITPHVKSITVVHMPEVATREAALRADEIQIGALSLETINDTVSDIGGTIQEIGIPRPRGFQMAGNYWSTECADCPGGVMPRPGFEEAEENPDRFPWIGIPGDPESMESARKVRWAMAMAVNQEALVEQILEGNGRVIYTWQNILPDNPVHKDEWVIPYDPEMARQYMEEAGYPDGFEMEVWIPGTFPPSAQRGAEATVEMWRQELNIDVTVSKTDYAVRRPQTVDKTINVPFTHGINWVPGATSARYICPAGGHIVGFTMEDEVCETGLQNATESSLQKRIENNIRVQDYLTEQMLFIPMFQTAEALFAVSPDIAEWDPYNAQDVLPNRPESIALN